MTKEVQLTKGYVAIVDDEDYPLVACHAWRTIIGKTGCVYAMTHIRKSNGKKTTLSMHRMLMGVTDSKVVVDHISGDGLDNRRCNMRLCTNTQNAWNQGVHKKSVSGAKGVSQHRGRWQSLIRVHGKRIYLGCFTTIAEAAAAYRAAATQYHGEFARF